MQSPEDTEDGSNAKCPNVEDMGLGDIMFRMIGMIPDTIAPDLLRNTPELWNALQKLPSVAECTRELFERHVDDHSPPCGPLGPSENRPPPDLLQPAPWTVDSVDWQCGWCRFQKSGKANLSTQTTAPPAPPPPHRTTAPGESLARWLEWAPQNKLQAGIHVISFLHEAIRELQTDTWQHKWDTMDRTRLEEHQRFMAVNVKNLTEQQNNRTAEQQKKGWNFKPTWWNVNKQKTANPEQPPPDRMRYKRDMNTDMAGPSPPDDDQDSNSDDEPSDGTSDVNKSPSEYQGIYHQGYTREYPPSELGSDDSNRRDGSSDVIEPPSGVPADDQDTPQSMAQRSKWFHQWRR